MEITDLLAIPLMLIKSVWLVGILFGLAFATYVMFINPRIKKWRGVDETWADRLNDSMRRDAEAKYAAEMEEDRLRRERFEAQRAAKGKGRRKWWQLD